jgi:hypothetical protein
MRIACAALSTAAQDLLKAELRRRNLTYGDLAENLAAIGVKDNERNITNKIAR